MIITLRLRHMVCGALLLLAGCASLLPERAAVGTPERACEDSADADPQIHQLYVQMATAPVPQNFAGTYNATRNNFIRKCVRVRGGQQPDGVQPVQQ